MVVKTYRGLLADGGQDRIRLSTIKGKVGYKIIKFQVVGSKPGALNYEAVLQIWKTNQTTVTATINFTDSDLLAVGLWSSQVNAEVYSDDMTIIFDNEIFNQDIYITNQDLQDQAVNYYLELEVIPLDDDGAAYTTLRDMRGTGT